MIVPPTWSQLNKHSIEDAFAQLCYGNLGQNSCSPSFSLPPLSLSPLSLSLSLFSSPLQLNLYDQVASTNATVWNLIQQGAKAGTVAIARQQSAGKGQRGRQWQSPLGGLYLSLALEPHLPVQQASHLILSIVWGVAIALRACHVPVQIKWPNDLVISMPSPPSSPPHKLYKLGGILTETRSQGQILSHAVIGMGLNGANPVSEPGIALTSVLSQLNISPVVPLLTSLNGLAAIAIYGILLGWQRLQQVGIDPIMKDYNALFVYRNHVISIPLNGQPQTVCILGVEASGDLLVQPASIATACGREAIEEIRISPSTIQLGYRA